MAVGRGPGVAVDRTGIALIAAFVLFGVGAGSGERVIEAVDFPTLIILFGLMILSAQFATSGFYDWISLRISTARGSPAMLLAFTVATAGCLSAVLANDVVVFAMTPLLCVGLRSRGRSEEHTSELQSLMRISYAVLCFKTKNKIKHRK